MATYQKITNHLQGLANIKTARQSMCFFKTEKGDYGYGDIFLGIRVPVIRQCVKQFSNTPLGTVKKLIKSKYHEIRLFALLLLVARFSKADTDEKELIYNLYLSHTRYINNWDLVDSSAYQIVGTFLNTRDRSALYTLANSESLWERRIAIISTFYYIRNNEYKDTLHISKLLLNDEEDLIHKAVGWMLREVGKRNQAVEVKFLKKHYKTMPRTMLRYAIEKFSERDRKKYLNNRI